MRWRALFVAVLATTAGCSAIGGSGETPSTLTPAPVPTDAPESGAGATVAPGVWADGRVDVDVLVDAQQAVLANRSFRWRAERNWTGTVGNVTSQSTGQQLVVVENATRYYRDATIFLNHPNNRFYTRFSEYANGTDRFVRARAYSWSQTRYDRMSVSPGRNRLARSTTAAVRRFLSVKSIRVERVQNGERPLYRLSGQLAGEAWGPSVRNYSVTAYVRADGLVRNLTATYTSIQAGSVEHVRYHFAFERIGNVTITRPAWVETARVRIENGTATPPP
jgi:hypothetical protein